MSFEQCNNCRWYIFQEDRNGDIAITWCGHELNPDQDEGNTTEVLCPIVGEPEPKYLHHPEQDNGKQEESNQLS